LQKLAVVWAKNANFFAKLFGEIFFKSMSSVPGHKPLCILNECVFRANPCVKKWLGKYVIQSMLTGSLGDTMSYVIID
jgi:hypothetical protein